MATRETPFGTRIRELREARRPRGKKTSAQELANALHHHQGWTAGNGSAGRSRIANLEAGRFANVTRGECEALGEVLGVPADELWTLALQDERKVDPEVRAYYEERIAALHASAERVAKTDTEQMTLTAGEQWLITVVGMFGLRDQDDGSPMFPDLADNLGNVLEAFLADGPAPAMTLHRILTGLQALPLKDQHTLWFLFEQQVRAWGAR